MSQEWIDTLLTKLSSRKLLVFLVATVLLCCGILSSELWVTVAGTYIGTEGLVDVVTRYKQPVETKANENVVDKT